ncbi:hypothetical protein E2C06_33910 [Dankookia rubra]|uniref:Uncharacterized protein n=1 Tax=Dankookia rubra TaxID=1442381 RepID=A0A4R5Q5M7_9PROT|nr:hypothetical protein [Dankookia rubra]TDH58190.1 hypothetical protein E2C06_33910 [Dankookia rubra]
MGRETSGDHPLPLPPADQGAPSVVFTATQPGEVAAASETYASPPPDTIVAPRQHGVHAEDQGQASATLNHDAQAAEVARLTQALHGAKQVHAAEIERLRAQHAAEMQRLVEALWQAQDAARAVSALPERATETPNLEPSELQPARLPAGLARFVDWRELSACAALGRIGRRWATAFRAWS